MKRSIFKVIFVAVRYCVSGYSHCSSATCSTHLSTRSTRLSTLSTRLFTRSTRLLTCSTRLSTRLSTRSTFLSTRTICLYYLPRLSTRSTRSTIWERPTDSTASTTSGQTDTTSGQTSITNGQTPYGCLTFIFYQKYFLWKNGFKAFLFWCDDLGQYTAYNINREELIELKNNIKKEKLQDKAENLQS